MKKIFFFLFLLHFAMAGISQQALQVQHGDKGLYLVHTVAPKENWYSVGRLYAISPKEIAAFNNTEMAKGLNIGQTINIPLTAANFSQASAASGRPVYYTVGEKEGLYRVSLKNNKVLMADLRKWNSLRSDAITTGQKLIVGYLGAAQPGPAVAVTPSGGTPHSTEVQNPPALPRKDTTVKTERPPTEDPGSAVIPAKKVEVVPTPAPSSSTPRTASSDGRGGFFRTQYEQQAKGGTSKDATVTSGIFKTASGWQDMKYYILIDGVEPGTLVKVSNTAGSKTIYAKVLGGMSGIRQNTGFDVRISNAAANVLETGDAEKFQVRVQY
ncbi:LysM peptidoglycan-binding domain-containing protein [Flaviaesturariibacter flavus]|uniref:LysM peptidoglycan-binding domain-containing protein n=1 Tax=Flaviaesturariibacter flavus TaxID=2502780 RepID=A0A4R1BJN8_9BACT|nr:LysM peptidoglycan-binding domain-containing protein [Flaviaesturariibacter flavus]TCJ17504.1 LysM peptidoglycan-binding domain-containing protein [Flaviaesturariibacter flavus]